MRDLGEDCFENAGDTEDLVVFVVFGSSAREPGDEIGIVPRSRASAVAW